MTKIHFAFEGATGEFSPIGEYDTPIDSELAHRFELKNGKVVDKYNGISDDDVKLQDHIDAIHLANNNIDHLGQLNPLTPPPPLGWIAPEDHKSEDETSVATPTAPSINNEENAKAKDMSPSETLLNLLADRAKTYLKAGGN